MKKSLSILILVLTIPVFAQTSLNMTMLSNLTLAPYIHGNTRSGTADVWYENGFCFVAQRDSGFVIIDVSSPTNPQIVFTFNPGDSYVQDVKTLNNLLFATNESNNGIGMYIFDITNPTNPTQLTPFSYTGKGFHNVWVEPNALYGASNVSKEIEIYDYSNINSLTLIGSVNGNPTINGEIHDMVVVNNKLYGAFIKAGGGFVVADVTNPANPVNEIVVGYQDSFTHNIFPSQDGNYIFTTDENPPTSTSSAGFMRVWDISNPNNVTQVAQYSADTTIVIHNVIIKNNFAIISHYQEGVRILDVTNPAQPQEIAFYDTFPINNLPAINDVFNGCWGVYPNGNLVYASDIQNGFFVFQADTLTTSVEENTNLLVKKKTFELSQNFPNPFNPSTVFPLELKEKSEVKLTIFDVKGRVVDEIENSVLSAGSYNFSWSGTDNSGKQVSSGTYFLNAEVNGFLQVMKITLLK